MKIAALPKFSQPIRTKNAQVAAFKANCQPLRKTAVQKDCFVSSKAKK